MAPFKPYKFIIFDNNLKNSHFYTKIISYLNLSLLCKEIYINEKYNKIKYENVCNNKLVFFSENNLLEKLKKNVSLYGESMHSKSNLLSINENIIDIQKPIKKDLSSKSCKVQKNDEIKSKNLMKKTQENENVPQNYENNQIINDTNKLVSFLTYDNRRKDDFLKVLNLNKLYNVDHINILCLNNYNSIIDLFKNNPFENKRISIFCPFHIINNDDDNNKYQKETIKKIIDFIYPIISDFLPLKYKHVYMSDLVRAIILNSELCQTNSKNELEIFKFIDMMEIIGKS
ncbi:conserved Plasmodium protein, unknown function [Plasmodium berghei]|uniref:Uncharacterized protein n=2 Tax=Plasmodium berghei TaxID=5821 RepID=A0A509AQ13_PLABA|nr:conserved Plasmodium protein, unknown function [Plasmodium berghei ANKA]CXI73328.1 conserved Plasmodium protein, unknown function [Plasmodium berghei]SCM24530.1 conserved Plasmodium protein, unknown function [Plasmodium berghei]SCN27091.1 conserved Plasmodium protein, unknown function [Plasmodium berghei]SCO61588.1 conserved Plasmodium protein, unknown function [Plasmodium berghei]SCO63513.1 conserved Plasmodium protein, unknown function [Plasmodium berghei]|eukprot:XP_034422725.1 conserved Plasmodium protein, unknown function [Plasmodium berghei ANKA]